jgi:hypothetical protein
VAFVHSLGTVLLVLNVVFWPESDPSVVYDTQARLYEPSEQDNHLDGDERTVNHVEKN